MFDIGFLELLVIGVMALIVLGPERLPKAARTVGLWIGKAKRSFNSMKTEIDRELQVKELKQQIEAHKAKIEDEIGADALKQSLGESQQAIDTAASEVQQTIHQPQQPAPKADSNDKPSTAE